MSEPKQDIVSNCPVVTVGWLLDRASIWLSDNKGARCPYRVALDKLGEVVRQHLSQTSGLAGSALDAACASAIEVARASPEVLCTLAMCDLCVLWTRTLLTSVKPRVADEMSAIGKSVDFAALTDGFARASVVHKKADDPAPLFSVWVDVGAHHSHCPPAGAGAAASGDTFQGDTRDRDREENRTSMDASAILKAKLAAPDVTASNTATGSYYCFANEAVYAAYRYFFRHAWESLPGVPASWKRPLADDVSRWIECVLRARDFALTLPQHRLLRLGSTRNAPNERASDGGSGPFPSGRHDANDRGSAQPHRFDTIADNNNNNNNNSGNGNNNGFQTHRPSQHTRGGGRGGGNVARPFSDNRFQQRQGWVHQDDRQSGRNADTWERGGNTNRLGGWPRQHRPGAPVQLPSRAYEAALAARGAHSQYA